MDILRKELNEVYASQGLEAETLPEAEVKEARSMADGIVRVTDGCAVITDASCDRCYIYSRSFGVLMGYAEGVTSYFEVDSSDEDAVYERIHPEDLVDKRLLEYEFFKSVDVRMAKEKTDFIAKCRFRMRDKDGKYRMVDNTTQLIRVSPLGKIWLIMCTYCLSGNQSEGDGISPSIVNTRTGDVEELSFGSRREEILSPREKEVLTLIRSGKPSKQIADILGISVHTVSRHRQNIIEKLSVGNSIEAVTAATLMRLF